MKDIHGFEARYGVTEDGRVWAYPRRYGANLSQQHDGLWLKPSKNKKGYLRVCLVAADGQRSNKRVNRLVAEAFLPNPLGLPEVNHKNGHKTDNRIANLEWCTTRENARHAFATGLRSNRREA